MPLETTIVILGHSGFIGSSLESKLTAFTRTRVIGRNLPVIDLTNECDSLSLIPYLNNQTTLVIAAAVKRQLGDSLESFMKNIQMIENICRLLRRFPVKQVIYISSLSVYGEEATSMNTSELTPIGPTSYYALSKYTGEVLLSRVCKESGFIKLTCLRAPLIYGARDSKRSYGPTGFCHAAVDGVPIILWGDGSELREFIYIDDFCAIVIAFINNPYEGIINVVSGISYTFKDILDQLILLGLDITVESRSRTKIKVDNTFNPTLINSIMPEKFVFTGLADGIHRTLSLIEPSP